MKSLYRMWAAAWVSFIATMIAVALGEWIAPEDAITAMAVGSGIFGFIGFVLWASDQ